MPEANFCPTCGTNLDPNTNQCPKCTAAPEGLVGKVMATTRSHPVPWMIGGGVATLAAIAAVVYFGGFLGPSGKDVCTAALAQAKDFGVISPAAALASNSAESTDVKDRRSCSVQVGQDTFTIQVDVRKETLEHKQCKSVKDAGCVAIWSVARSDGMTTYQVREIPPGDTDDAVAPLGQAPQQAALPGAGEAGATGSAAGDSSGLDAETQTDNTGATSTPPAQSGDQPQQ